MSAWRGWAWLLALLTFVFGATPDLTRTTMHSSTATPTTTSGTRSAPPTTGRATTSASTTSAAPAPPPATPKSASAFRSRIDPVTAEQLGGSYHQGCPVEPSALRMLTVSYLGFDGKSHTGRLVVAADWAAQLAGVFATLYRREVPDPEHATGDRLRRLRRRVDGRGQQFGVQLPRGDRRLVVLRALLRHGHRPQSESRTPICQAVSSNRMPAPTTSTAATSGPG